MEVITHPVKTGGVKWPPASAAHWLKTSAPPSLPRSARGRRKWPQSVQAARIRPVLINGRRKPGTVPQSRLDRLGLACSSSPMYVQWFLPLLGALIAEADFFQFDSISNVSTYYFNYIYCNIWEGDCQPNQDDATQQGRRKNIRENNLCFAAKGFHIGR